MDKIDNLAFPGREARQLCWDARDRYWDCLQKYNPDYNSNKEEKEPPQCVELRKLYQSGCPNQWVKHFDRKRTYEQFKKKMEKGYDPVNPPKENAANANKS